LTVWSIFVKSLKAFLGWLFLCAIFMVTAAFTGGFKVYCPLVSFLIGSIAVYFAILFFGLIFGVWKE